MAKKTNDVGEEWMAEHPEVDRRIVNFQLGDILLGPNGDAIEVMEINRKNGEVTGRLYPPREEKD